MEKRFNTVFELTMAFSAMGSCASAADAGVEAIKRAKLQEDNDGRKWAIVIPAGRMIIAAGRHGWVAVSEYGDVHLSDEYAATALNQNNPNRVKEVLTRSFLEGYPMTYLTNTFDSACLGAPLHEVDRNFTKIEGVIQQFEH